MSAVLAALGGEALGGIVKEVGSVIDDLVTTEEERRAGELEERKLDQQLLVGQQEINKEEAKHASKWVAGWRPAVGWVCVQALWFIYVPKAVVMTLIWVYFAWKIVAAWNGTGTLPTLPEFPELGAVDLIGLLFALLGMAGLRHRETIQGKARSEPLAPLPSIFRRKSAEQEAP
jgi:hypothetical protein